MATVLDALRALSARCDGARQDDGVQAEDRIHRIGQKNACTAYWLRYGHCDTKIDSLLAEKAEKIGVVLDDDSVKINYIDLVHGIF